MVHVDVMLRDGSLGRKGMKRLTVVVVGAISFALLSASSALADSSIQQPEVRGEVVTPPGAGGVSGSTAFTGIDITVWMLAVAALLVVGLGLLVAARRRARTAAHT
jgi:LPXTG-motif cell wall-anchored protein